MTTINCPRRRDYDSQSSLKVWPVRSRFPKKRPCHFLPRPATFDPDPVPPTLEFCAQNAGRAVCFPGIEGKIIGDRELRLSEAGHRRTLRRDRSAEKLTHDCQPNSVRLARVFSRAAIPSSSSRTSKSPQRSMCSCSSGADAPARPAKRAPCSERKSLRAAGFTPHFARCPGSTSRGEFRGQVIRHAVALAKDSRFDKSGLTLCQKGKNPAPAAGNRR
jgi:hypothetical protein